MLDIQLIRKETDRVCAGLRKRGLEPRFDELLGWDDRRRALIQEVETIKAERNRINKEIPAKKAKQEDIGPLLAQTTEMGNHVKRIDAEVATLETQIHEFLIALPNLPLDDVAAGGKEANEVVRTFGQKPDLGADPQHHVTLCTRLGLIDYTRGVKMAGNGHWLYTGLGAQLEWALLNYFVTTHIKDGYTFMLPPHLLNEESGYTAGQFPKFAEDVFRVDGESRFLLPTAETALINLYRDEILNEEDLPKRLFAYTPCYRREAGSYRASERGMIRGHQFNKVEMFGYTKPEDSVAMHKELIDKACALVEGLGLHYQLTKLAAGDVSASMATTYDVEIWMPSMNEYKEVSSISNACDYQARRGNIRFRRGKQVEYLHTLNGSGLATSRVLPAIVEQYQQPDGTVIVPEVLRPFLGTDRLG